jgi:hypothetical protein
MEWRSLLLVDEESHSDVSNLYNPCIRDSPASLIMVLTS